MIPIGAPVTATIPFQKLNGLLKYTDDDWMMVQYRPDLMPFCCHHHEVKIFIPDPAPFTLWQLNALTERMVNEPTWNWHSIMLHPKMVRRIFFIHLPE